jgi:hypothetical protein
VLLFQVKFSSSFILGKIYSNTSEIFLGTWFILAYDLKHKIANYLYQQNLKELPILFMQLTFSYPRIFWTHFIEYGFHFHQLHQWLLGRQPKISILQWRLPNSDILGYQVAWNIFPLFLLTYPSPLIFILTHCLVIFYPTSQRWHSLELSPAAAFLLFPHLTSKMITTFMDLITFLW